MSYCADEAGHDTSVGNATTFVITGRFTKVEDILLGELVKIHGARHWPRIANKIGTKTARQCRDRYNNYLDPRLNHEEWTTDEDSRLRSLYETHGPKWSMISRQLKTRSTGSVRNRWCLLARQSASNETKAQMLQSTTSNQISHIESLEDDGIHSIHDVLSEVFGDMSWYDLTS